MEHMEYPLEQPFNKETDNDDTENSVEFLAEVRIPCLICAVDIEIENSIKQEIDQECAGSPAVCQVANDGGVLDHDVFHWFLKWFGIEIVKKGNQRLVNRGWDGEGGDILRFCGNCKMELKRILEIQKQLDELEKKVKNGLREVKVKMERSEDAFKINRVYEKDPKYKLVRSQIVNCDPQQLLSQQPGYLSTGRRSSTIKVKSNVKSKVVTPAHTNNDDASVVKVPLAMILSLYKTITNLHLISIIQPNIPDTIGTNTETRSTIKNKIGQNFSRQKSTQIYKIQLCQKLIKKAKKNIQKKVTSYKLTRTKNNLTKTPTHKTYQKKSTSVTASILENCHDDISKSFSNNHINKQHANYSEPSNENDRSTNRPQRKRRTVSYTDYTSDDDEPGNSKSLSFKDNADGDQNSNSSKSSKLRNRKATTKPGKITQEKVCSRRSAQLGGQKDNTKNLIKTQKTQMTTEPLKKSPKIAKEGRRYRKWNYRLYPSTNTITFGGINFSIRADHPGKVSCNSCKKILQNNIDIFRRHVIKQHTNLYVCGQCPFRAEQENPLKRHIQSVHEGLVEMCPKCGKSYSNLRIHIRDTHEAKTIFKCGEKGCGKKFATRSSLKTHENSVHRKLKLWKCTKCTMSFYCKQYLDNHMNLHMGTRPWKCEEDGCGKAYVSKNSLNKHHRNSHLKGSKPKIK